ncbi:hypothetical protein RchiOBHm_Chr3g0482971 [Rosa chinensis]|uniref:Uncharacterized protein n=1 Tax=Rosa chinensis TaxID=74649 RepID=A0A2P6RED1_ROSCH|nr:hypothetical protein RchiOBHm_Chr3g0482971 [Rosa chinensis]
MVVHKKIELRNATNLSTFSHDVQLSEAIYAQEMQFSLSLNSFRVINRTSGSVISDVEL